MPVRNIVSVAPIALASGFAIVSSAAWATDASQLTGYGVAAMSMGGASIAFPQDSIAAANNPAGLAYVGNRIDLDVQFLGASSQTTLITPANRIDGSIIAPVPEMGFNYQLTPQITLGMSTFASGAAFNYSTSALPIPGMHNAQASFKQVVALPTVTYKVTDDFAVGASVGPAIQLFEASGLFAPGPNGAPILFDSYNTRAAFGVTGKVGALWNVTNWFSVGASYSPKTIMGNIPGYSKTLLSTVGGGIDIPEQYGVGIAIRPFDNVTIAVDYLHISWSDVRAYNDLFGWQDQDVFRAGISYDFNDVWTFRGGFSLANQAPDSDFATQNFILTGINSNAITAGFTCRLGGGYEFNLGLEYDIPNPLVGTGPSLGTEIRTDFWVLAMGFGMKF
ncbi:outer membrane protein transport protein [Xanthobacter dioxanivorans]|uniref:Outer membrane protein transport protein n=1 Tax=Xanthobacter dioxanivorans TaxID=2528964 RepID=A0A974PRH2_9HYPH|nr:outer membrane protein transport protein [Xanthobacter dioxanivorans]QRG08398.1 outer membrane protein transport protein [Xanthobacter dioxanivorans]